MCNKSLLYFIKMACKTSYELHHHFPRVAEESGFTFNTHRPRIRMDWNKIKLIDVDSLIKERKFIIIEQHLNDILDCVLESEFDVRILDEGVIKLFRLAQLAVEYQQFCRHYLDRSVYVLRQEITSLAQELNETKKTLHDKEEELKKLRRLPKHTQKYLPLYGNDNIATMILQTLSTKGVTIPPTSSNANIYQYNKCNHCGKVFLNQLYLQSHISRRHQNIVDIPQKESDMNDQNNENVKLSSEIMLLKNKLKEMETLIANTTELNTTTQDKNKNDSVHIKKKDMKDAEVSTNSENYLLDKIEEWKQVEREEHNKEINNLRNQIMEIVNTFKQKEIQGYTEKDSKLIEQLHATIIQQGAEIIALKKELDNSTLKATNDNLNRNREAEEQISLWAKRIETQSQQYESLLQKLNDVVRDAKESRALAMAERERAAQLQALIEQNFSKLTKNTNNLTDPEKDSPEVLVRSAVQKKPVVKVQHKNKFLENQTIENLHRKAQELLNIGSLSSSVSDLSSTDSKKPVINVSKIENGSKFKNGLRNLNQNEGISEKLSKTQNQTKDNPTHMTRKYKEQKNRDKCKAQVNIVQKNSITGSPVKVVRAKLTEEVNNRLVALGIDPLKCRLPQSVFQTQRSQLQHLRDLKSKKNSKHENLRHSILAHLDSSTAKVETQENYVHKEDVLPNKAKKPLQNITSVISGVKSKALSLVKLHDTKRNRTSEGAKEALSMLKTPLGSARHSPQQKTISNLSTESDNETQENGNVNSKRNLNFNINRTSKINNKDKTQIANSNSETSIESEEYDDIEHTAHRSSKSIENLIKSPARRPSFTSTDYKQSVQKYAQDDTNNFINTQSATNSNDNKPNSVPITKTLSVNNLKDIDDLCSSPNAQLKKVTSEENMLKQTRGVLKNASSTSTLNKKKVIFDMEAIQMKSLSASPSQSITEKSNSPNNYELGLTNLDDEEWDISSIENEPLKNDTKLQFRTGASPKILELKQEIESQLARRVSATGLASAVDVLGLGVVAVSKTTSIGGSNTSLGSSILDESEAAPVINRKAFEKPKTAIKDDSDLDMSNFSLRGFINKCDKNGTF